MRRALAPLRLEGALTRCIAALDYWILFTVRLSRRPGPWIALHGLLSVPLLLRMDQHRLELEHGGERMRVRCRTRSSRLGGLLPGAAAAETGSTAAADRDPDLEVVQVHPWTALWWRRRGWLTVPAFVRYQGRLDAVPPARPSKSSAQKPRQGRPQRLSPAARQQRGLGARPGDNRIVGSSAVRLRGLVSPAARVDPDASPRSRDHDRRRRTGCGDSDRVVGGRRERPGWARSASRAETTRCCAREP